MMMMMMWNRVMNIKTLLIYDPMVILFMFKFLAAFFGDMN